MTKNIYIKTSFEAFHKYTNAPQQVAFLRNYHRHKFYVKVELSVSNEDRELEFFIIKKIIDDYLMAHLNDTYSEKSCEMFAHQIFLFITKHKALSNTETVKVTVSEDDENGASIKGKVNDK